VLRTCTKGTETRKADHPVVYCIQISVRCYELLHNSPMKLKYIFHFSELRLVESLDGLCERVLQYNIHKERKDSTRFDKGMSQTFQTLHGLV
jgi:hypothetical protein